MSNRLIPGNRQLVIPAACAVLALGMILPPVAVAAAVSDKEAIALTRPKSVVIGDGLSRKQLSSLERPVNAFYGFWVNGSPALLNEALSSAFVDHTLPPGRPQGPTGPATAYAAFSKAVPDLRVEVVQRIYAKDRVVSHLRFTGHFSGSFGGAVGKGQNVDFIATDILRVQKGKVTDNWHLEDNLTFLKQIGQVK
ncbi:ester cyclase [Ochrobactrum soli]|uniref:Lipoprotein, putative n=1 Tax=Ochrobactrum soli TaxID=2448455 RepID=A0A2P9HEB4_9HYPH|nr:ester cyclase [[Ochrobactrum] soli]SPL62431.1 lipoprotein, putative [[Ochrobactrum] soli]